MCEACELRCSNGDQLVEDTAPVRALMARILRVARAGDEEACASVLEEARAIGLGAESVLVGLLQPALYQAGLEWRDARMSVTEEHRLTSWCERIFHLLAPASRPVAPIDVLIVQPPGNVHTVGIRFAARILSERGLQVATVFPAIPFEELVAGARSLRPRFIGFSCALPASIPVAVDLVARLRASRARPPLPVCPLRLRHQIDGGGARAPDAGHRDRARSRLLSTRVGPPKSRPPWPTSDRREAGVALAGAPSTICSRA